MNMGARSFNPGSDSFLQPDIFHGALDNLGLSTDALSQNRYSLAGGNPLSYIESDGHVVVADGGGGGSSSPSPSSTNQSSTSGGGGHKDCGFLGLGCTGVGEQVGQFVQGVGDGLGDMWKGGQALGSIAMDCAQGGAAECGSRLEKMGSYIVDHPGDFFGSLVDYKDLSQGNFAKWAGHLAPSIVLTVATAGAAGALAKAGEAAGLAAEGAEVAGEAGGMAAGEAAGEAGAAVAEAGAGKAVHPSGEAAGDAAAGAEKAASEAGSGLGQSGAAGSAGEDGGYLYRGVAEDHPAYSDAVEGIARPRNPTGHAEPLAHNLGDTDSQFTSWSRDINVANRFAGDNGVIMRIPADTPPPGTSFVQSPDLFDEQEVLVRGIVTGAEVLR